ncbi:MAG: MarR family transcriptional regulator [Oligoflexia bacterium]|nr:MarR family transcriptional regulator [Oligoflexia bacterium]
MKHLTEPKPSSPDLSALEVEPAGAASLVSNGDRESALFLAKTLLDTVPFVMRMIRTEMRLAAKGIFTVPQFRTINQLRKRPHTNRELAEWMGVAPPTMSRMIDTLMKRGWLEKTRDKADMRQQLLTLTPLGRQEANRVRSIVRKKIAIKLGSLDKRQHATLADGLEVLRDLFT